MADQISKSVKPISILIIIVILSIFFAYIQNFLDYPQMIGAIFTAVLLFVSILNLSVSEKMVYAAEKQVEAVKDSMNFDVMPRIHFGARPANDYWKLPPEVQQKRIPGVGLYFQNLGRGPAFNLKLEIKIIGKNERIVNETIDKINVNELYTIPSPKNPNLVINQNDVKLVVKFQYENIVMPPIVYNPDEVTIDITPELFEEPDKPASRPPVHHLETIYHVRRLCIQMRGR